MPRGKRGGARQPTAGKNYPNRSDLQAQPVRTATGQEYGKASEQAAAQRAVPMAGAPTAPAAAGPGGGPPPGPMPGTLGDFTRPTERPGEPLTAGAPAGLGPGPEALAMNKGVGGSAEDQGDLDALRAYLPTLELMANLPGATAAGRNYVRRLRGAVSSPQSSADQPPSPAG